MSIRALKKLPIDSLIEKTSQLTIAKRYLDNAIHAYTKDKAAAQRQAKAAYTTGDKSVLTDQQEKALKADTSSGGQQRYQNYRLALDNFSAAKATWKELSEKQ